MGIKLKYILFKNDMLKLKFYYYLNLTTQYQRHVTIFLYF